MNEGIDILPDLRLKLHLECPDFDDVYFEGYEAGIKGISEATNPYHKNSSEYHYWSDGWWCAFNEEAPIFQLASTKVHTEIVADTTVISANDESILDKRKDNLLCNMFKVLATLFAGLVVYNVYDFAT